MKAKVDSFKKNIRFVVSIFASREFAFIYCLLGTIGQIAHTYFLASAISSFDGVSKVIQACIVSTVISSSLLYFVAISDKTDEDYRKNMWAINILMFIEIVINLYYYARHLLIDPKVAQVFDFIFAILISCLIPVIIKLYASHIRAKEWLKIINDEGDTKPTTEETTKVEEDLYIMQDVISETLSATERIEQKLDELLTNEQHVNEVDNDDLRNELVQVIEEMFEKKSKEVESTTTTSTIDEAFLTNKIDEIKSELTEYIEKKNNINIENFDDEVAKIFKKESDSFLTKLKTQQDNFLRQSENKLKLFMDEKAAEINKNIDN